MNKETLNCELITPMFSSGMDTKKAELRASELKALMRYVYRISNQTLDTQKLYEEEARLFGDAEKHASPIRLQLVAGELKTERKLLLLHPKAGHKPISECYPEKGTYSIVLRKFLNKGEGMSFYRNLILLSFILGGMGKRSRRGRGCSAVVNAGESAPDLTREALLPWMTEQLNLLNATSASPAYVLEKDIIRFHPNRYENWSRYNRPVIEKIRLGKPINNVNKFLLEVDLASHKIKLSPPKNNLFATGYAYKGSKFASSLLISVTRTSKGELLPVYTFVKAVVDRNTPLDKDHTERNEMISFIEGGTF
ncbi:hypothetical protein [Paenibacillus chitinolyticus]|uniref:hypothetical protein n=1 Tax=Paenibacillus chitinolyticus TaxID=79263 RepID=UPI00366018C6